MNAGNNFKLFVFLKQREKQRKALRIWLGKRTKEEIANDFWEHERTIWIIENDLSIDPPKEMYPDESDDAIAA